MSDIPVGDVGDLPHNEGLLHALEQAALAGPEADRGPVYEALEAAAVLLPTTRLADERGVELLVAHDADGRPVVAAFTDLDRLRAWSDAAASVVVVPGAELAPLVVADGAAGVALNPGTAAMFVISGPDLDALAGGSAAAASAAAAATAAAEAAGAAVGVGVGVGVGVDQASEEAVRKLAPALRSAAARHPLMLALHVFSAAGPDGAPILNVGVELAPEASRPAAEAGLGDVAAEVQRVLPEGMPCDVRPLAGELLGRARRVCPPIAAGGELEEAMAEAAAADADAVSRHRILRAMAGASILLPADGERPGGPPRRLGEGEIVALPLIDRNGRTYVAGFSSTRALLATRPPGIGVVEVAGAGLAAVVPAGAWLVMDPGTLHATELSPGALAELASLASAPPRPGR